MNPRAKRGVEAVTNCELQLRMKTRKEREVTTDGTDDADESGGILLRNEGDLIDENMNYAGKRLMLDVL